ncbi:hypothetical protein [Dysgonomonas sp. ZJ709]|uniref:hypothetical protein n=1 Tax=Dysgonomonas sp. ZJ709 TaxID=2709797 RepID=UPI0013EB3594|nr:hypothetical protein [Dysgonomonas sp. ZJ709]
MQIATKVAFNTGILYGKMLLTVGISLYATRLVLNSLGAADYGIYTLVAGVIAMLSFLNTAMATSTQRYLSFNQGVGDLKMQKIVFANSLLLHILIAFFVVIILEIIGLFLFDGFLNIPIERISTARKIYHFMSATVFFTMISPPFIASLNAHENMLWIAIINIVEVLLKLGIALALFRYEGDKLFFYGTSIAVTSIICLILYALYCIKRYEECSLLLWTSFSAAMMRKLTSFAGWNLFGALCGIARTQGLAVVLNLFLGTVINAAYGIANQVAGQMNFFSAALLQALNPQIMKSEGLGNRNRMLRFSMMASKFGFFLMALVTIPSIFEMSTILKLWLKDVPDNTVVFCNLMLIGIMVNQLTIGLQSAIQAIGKIEMYQVVVGSIILLNLPVAYFLLKFKFPSYSILVAFIFLELLACSFRLYFLKRLGGLSVKEYVNRVFFREILPVIFSVAFCIISLNIFDFSFRFAFTMLGSMIIFSISIYIFGLERDERQYIDKFIGKTVNKMFKNNN